ncbi:MAG: hypothetical protein HAW67_00415 [Endozoicomonadaceae bacterium]|nr:hypothetical protein [Endozoicomonadaceae bacterium]
MAHSKKNDLPIKWLALINAYSIASEKAKTCRGECKNCPNRKKTEQPLDQKVVQQRVIK